MISVTKKEEDTCIILFLDTLDRYQWVDRRTGDRKQRWGGKKGGVPPGLLS